jgi:hypothetical protein
MVYSKAKLKSKDDVMSKYYLYWMASDALRSWAVAVEWYVVYSVIHSLVFKEKFILACNCIVRNSILVFAIVNNFSDFVGVSE